MSPELSYLFCHSNHIAEFNAISAVDFAAESMNEVISISSRNAEPEALIKLNAAKATVVRADFEPSGSDLHCSTLFPNPVVYPT